MKTYIIYIMALLCILGFAACSDDDTTPTLTKVIPSVIDELPASEYVLTNPGEENLLLFTATWTETMFHLDGSSNPVPAAPANYTLQIDRAGNNFSSPQTVTATSSLAVNIYVRDFNQVLLNALEATPGEPVEVELRLLVNYGQNNAREIISDNKIALTVTPYLPPKDLDPIYLIGDMNGWDVRNTDYVMFRDDNDGTNGVYTYTGNFGSGCWLKFCGKEYLGSFSNLYYSDGNGILKLGEKEDGAFYIQGYATVSIDVINMTWQITPYTSEIKSYSMVGPIGEFCNWDNEPLMNATAYDSHQWNGEFTFENQTTIKFRADRDWAKNWGAQSFDIPFGHGVFDGPGATTPAGTYRIYFNDLTGYYIILKK